MMDIDFTEWTDAQLEAASSPRMIAASPTHGPLLLAEVDRRKAAGVWRTDGSHERTAAFAAQVRTRRPRRNRRNPD